MYNLSGKQVSETKFPLSKATETEILRAAHGAEIGESYKDEVYVHTIRSLKGLKNTDEKTCLGTSVVIVI